MKGMAQAEGDEMFVSTAAVGSIVGLQSAEILQMASEYEEKRADLAAGKKPDKASGAQAHKRMVAALEKQIAIQEKKCEAVRRMFMRVSHRFDYLLNIITRFKVVMMNSTSCMWLLNRNLKR